MAIKILIAMGIDAVLFLGFILWWQPSIDESTIELLLLTAIFVINIGLAVAFKYTIRSWYFTLVLNSIIAVLIFHIILIGWYAYQDSGMVKMIFSGNEKHYELVLDKKDTSYSFYEKYSDGSLNRFMSGQYKISNDTVYLTDPVNQMMVYKDTLIGFEKKKIVLKEE
ncbi:MAG TPA: hypothetical protein VHC47_12975 [Mucilaginibacter sp.]|nr:hypothetical protein [Mucilaginibacter sp.]